jgi:hypothetical protein
MPEIKNTFVKSKMNKDLDAKLLPNGEYREGVNISVSTSEGASVGSLENVRGNNLISNFNTTSINSEIIGSAVDIANDRILLFLTDYSDTSASELDLFSARSVTGNGNIKKGRILTRNVFQDITGATPGTYNPAIWTTNGSGQGAIFRVVIGSNGQVDSVSQVGGIYDSSSFDIGDIIIFDGAQFGTTGSIRLRLVRFDLHNSQGATHKIVYINTLTKTFDTIVEGTFLNFSKTHPIQSSVLEDFVFFTDNRNQPRKININTAISNPLTYYTKEDDISVAKFAPYNSPKFFTKISGKYKSTLRNTWDKYLPSHFIFPAAPHVLGTSRPSPDHGLLLASGINASYLNTNSFINNGNSVPPSTFGWKIENLTVPGTDGYFVAEILPGAGGDELRLIDSNGADVVDLYPLNWSNGNVYGISLLNPDYSSTAAGGSREYLEDKFARFSYRFKYEDDEYSLMAPFSQHAFVPKKYGSFIYGDDQIAAASGIVKFMENQINEVDLCIEMPYALGDLANELNIKSIEILYKSSDEQAVKVVSELSPFDFNKGPIESLDTTSITPGSGYYGGGNAVLLDQSFTSSSGTLAKFNVTITAGEIVGVTLSNQGKGYLSGETLIIPPLGFGGVPASGSGGSIKIRSLTKELIYTYSCQKPIKTLPENTITRTSDIAPIRAKTLEIVGNRVVYGNFMQSSITPDNLDYSLQISEKLNFTGNSSTTLPQTRRQYYNHTVKQGRNYQVGLVLYDRYGRSSNVIISTINTDPSVSNSTIFSPFTSGGSNPLGWPGNSLKMIINNKIEEESSGDYLGVYSNTNPLGWYSYRVVVKQDMHDYYNIYVPGGVSGNITWNGSQKISYSSPGTVFNIPLFNDNINKINRDLQEPGPQDTQFSSSTILYNRLYQPDTIYNTAADGINFYPVVNRQNREADKITVTQIKPFREFGDWTNYKGKIFTDGTTGATGYYPYPGPTGGTDPFYLASNENPLIATISTKKRLGYLATINVADDRYVQDDSSTVDSLDYSFAKKLQVFETKPMTSALDIFHETSSSGLISDFNTRVSDTLPASDPVDSSGFYWAWRETDQVGNAVSNEIGLIDSSGNFITNPNVTGQMIELLDANGNSITNSSNFPFDLEITQPGVAPSTSPRWSFILKKQGTYKADSSSADNYSAKCRFVTSGGLVIVKTFQNLSLTNEPPVLYKANIQCADFGFVNRDFYKLYRWRYYINQNNNREDFGWMEKVNFNDVMFEADQPLFAFTDLGQSDLPRNYTSYNGWAAAPAPSSAWTDYRDKMPLTVPTLKGLENGSSSSSSSSYLSGLVVYIINVGSRRVKLKGDFSLGSYVGPEGLAIWPGSSVDYNPSSDWVDRHELGSEQNVTSWFEMRNGNYDSSGSSFAPTIHYVRDSKIENSDMIWGGASAPDGQIGDAIEFTFNIGIYDANGQAGTLSGSNHLLKYYVWKKNN